MPRDRQAVLNTKLAKGRRAFALARHEFRTPSSERIAPKGLTSFPIKVLDGGVRKMIDDALEIRKTK